VEHLTFDGAKIVEGMVVFTRRGDCYPVPGVWRVYEWHVEYAEGGRVRIGRPGYGAWRTPSELFAVREAAKYSANVQRVREDGYAAASRG